MYFARRLRKRRMTISSLSEKVNHIFSSASFTPFDPGYGDALEHSDRAIEEIYPGPVRAARHQRDGQLLPQVEGVDRVGGDTLFVFVEGGQETGGVGEAIDIAQHPFRSADGRDQAGVVAQIIEAAGPTAGPAGA